MGTSLEEDQEIFDLRLSLFELLRQYRPIATPKSQVQVIQQLHTLVQNSYCLPQLKNIKYSLINEPKTKVELETELVDKFSSHLNDNFSLTRRKLLMEQLKVKMDRLNKLNQLVYLNRSYRLGCESCLHIDSLRENLPYYLETNFPVLAPTNLRKQQRFFQLHSEVNSCRELTGMKVLQVKQVRTKEENSTAHYIQAQVSNLDFQLSFQTVPYAVGPKIQDVQIGLTSPLGRELNWVKRLEKSNQVQSFLRGLFKFTQLDLKRRQRLELLKLEFHQLEQISFSTLRLELRRFSLVLTYKIVVIDETFLPQVTLLPTLNDLEGIPSPLQVWLANLPHQFHHSIQVLGIPKAIQTFLTSCIQLEK